MAVKGVRIRIWYAYGVDFDAFDGTTDSMATTDSSLQTGSEKLLRNNGALTEISYPREGKI